jgi:hypothetical protein
MAAVHPGAPATGVQWKKKTKKKKKKKEKSTQFSDNFLFMIITLPNIASYILGRTSNSAR